jgi:glycosyltransferase involved in cell wall biosynthesis
MASLSVTFLTPHQRLGSGGAYAIEQFAHHLAAEARVTLGVGKGGLREVPGVEVLRAGRLDEAVLPDADAILLPADTQRFDRVGAIPRRKGIPVLLFQGYGAPGNPAVIANLDRFDRVLAVATWLLDEARQHGCRVEHVPCGLDRSIFYAGRPAADRAPRVAMMTSSVDSKGTADGVRALEIVRHALPGVELCAFGKHDPGGDIDFLASSPATHRQVAELMRDSAVFVCSSWEEGFGMPGMEALACGAALATTDTKGSRDYAVDGETALVSPPRRPEALAATVVRLLRDPSLRGRLAASGQRLVHERFRPWPEAAKRFAAALRTVLG